MGEFDFWVPEDIVSFSVFFYKRKDRLEIYSGD